MGFIYDYPTSKLEYEPNCMEFDDQRKLSPIQIHPILFITLQSNVGGCPLGTISFTETDNGQPLGAWRQTVGIDRAPGYLWVTKSASSL